MFMTRSFAQSRLVCFGFVLIPLVLALNGCTRDVIVYAEPADAGPDAGVTLEVSPPSAPIWPNGSQLTVSQVEAHALVLSWSPATHPDGVARYRLHRDGVEFASLYGNTHAVQVSQLSPWTSYTFRVEAEEAFGTATTDGPEVSVQTSDDTRPEWPDGTSLLASEVTDASATLAWGEAMDDVAITTYHVYRDNIPLGIVDSDTTQLAVDLPEPGKSYTFRVEASDAADNTSINGPTTVVDSDDETLPWWPDDSQVMASNIQPTSLSLGWTPAQDDVGVVSYRIYRNAVHVMDVDSNQTSTVMEELAPWQDHTFRVEALDNAGHLSSGGPEITLQTPDNDAPTWSDGATLLASNVSADELTLGWGAAADDVAVTEYRIFLEYVLVGTTDGATTSLKVTGWGSVDVLSFQVQALDEAGNLSTNGPSLTVTLTDDQAPVWPDGSQILLSNLGPAAMTVGWSAATDNEAVAGYNLLLNGTTAQSVGGDQTSTTVSGLEALTEYTVELEAVDSVGNTSSNNPQTTVTTPDHPVPVWPLDSTLQASNLGETSLMLTWSALPETFAIASFVIQQDDVEVATADGTANSVTVNGLSPTATYGFQVQAVGVTGKISTNGPQVTVTTPDLTAPEWPTDAKLETVDVQANSVLLTWTPATDGIAVSQYRLLQNDSVIKTTDGDTTQWTAENLNPETTYLFLVLAGDAADQWSATGPSLSVTTLPDGPIPLTNETAYTGLSALCLGCHAAGALGFFATLSDFETSIVGDTKYVVPGDPDASAFLGLLEGGSSLAPNSGGQMPPDPNSTFAQQAANGATTITMEQLENWIEAMGGNP